MRFVTFLTDCPCPARGERGERDTYTHMLGLGVGLQLFGLVIIIHFQKLTGPVRLGLKIGNLKTPRPSEDPKTREFSFFVKLLKCKFEPSDISAPEMSDG